MPRVGIALGSNLGPRLANLQAAMALLRRVARPGGEVAQAPVYQTSPVRCRDGSPDFYNTVVEIGYDGSPGEFLKHAQAIESALGRLPSTERNAPRLIDIDLLYFGNTTLDSRTLVLPHPRLTQRRFVLQPLADIRPNLILPGDDRSIAERLAKLVSDEPPLTLVHANW